jgi:hypothetical protein
VAAAADAVASEVVEQAAALVEAEGTAAASEASAIVVAMER